MAAIDAKNVELDDEATMKSVREDYSKRQKCLLELEILALIVK